jgi:hypothetical protein
MCGGAFATVPAYLADLFGTQNEGAIHGRLLTAWATAGILDYVRDYQLSLGLSQSQVYNQTMYILVGMLILGLVCSLMIRPVADKWLMTDDELTEEKRLAHEKASSTVLQGDESTVHTLTFTIVLAWTFVCLPLARGIHKIFLSALKLFL